jgi:hypothetical protein
MAQAKRKLSPWEAWFATRQQLRRGQIRGLLTARKNALEGRQHMIQQRVRSLGHVQRILDDLDKEHDASLVDDGDGDSTDESTDDSTDTRPRRSR